MTRKLPLWKKVGWTVVIIALLFLPALWALDKYSYLYASDKLTGVNAIAEIRVTRSPANPLVTPASSQSIGTNIGGPSVIHVPSWVKQPLGKYYMYFTHHGGQNIRLAYADTLEGPWTVYEPGTLKLTDTTVFRDHLASPDVHVDEANQRIYMYFHGEVVSRPDQWTGVATSVDGIHFSASETILGPYTFRVFQYGDYYYAIAKGKGWRGGRLLRSGDPLGEFETRGYFIPRLRRSAVMLQGDTLIVFYSRIGDAPEGILATTVDLTGDWEHWKASEPVVVILPETDYEGVQYPIEPSRRGRAVAVRQLRDPCIFIEDGKVYLFYSIAGEMGIAMAELEIRLR